VVGILQEYRKMIQVVDKGNGLYLVGLESSEAGDLTALADAKNYECVDMLRMVIERGLLEFADDLPEKDGADELDGQN